MPPTKPPFWSRPIAPLLLGVGACAACCAVPIVAVVLGASAAGAAAWLLEPLAAGMVVAAVVLAGVVYQRRARARAAASCDTTGACAIDQSCGCGPSPKDRARAVGCTLADDEMPDRLDAFQDLFRRGLKRRWSSAGRAEWVFDWSPSLEAEARALAAAEQGCCNFYDFEIRRDGDELRWTTAAPADRHDAITLLDGIAATIVPSSSRA